MVRVGVGAFDSPNSTLYPYYNTTVLFVESGCWLFCLLCVQVRALDSVPQFDVIPHLPVFIDGLFVILSDDSKEIRKM